MAESYSDLQINTEIRECWVYVLPLRRKVLPNDPKKASEILNSKKGAKADFKYFLQKIFRASQQASKFSLKVIDVS